MLALNRPPYGCRIEKEGPMWRLEIYEPEAEIIRMIFIYGDENGERMTLKGIELSRRDGNVL